MYRGTITRSAPEVATMVVSSRDISNIKNDGVYARTGLKCKQEAPTQIQMRPKEFARPNVIYRYSPFAKLCGKSKPAIRKVRTIVQSL